MKYQHSAATQLTLDQARSIFRRQVAYVKCHIKALDGISSELRKQSIAQACLQGLHLGVLVYFKSVFNAPNLRTVDEFLGLRKSIEYSESKGVEILSLLDDENSWTRVLFQSIDSMADLHPKTGTDDLSLGANLIAVSDEGVTRHWTTIIDTELYSLIDAAEELVDRHFAHDQEY